MKLVVLVFLYLVRVMRTSEEEDFWFIWLDEEIEDEEEDNGARDT